MRSMRFLLISIASVWLITPAVAQLTADQKAADFQSMSALYAKRYAPYEWKKQALKFDLYDIAPWLAKVRASKTDVDFFEVCAQYVASLRDTHSSFTAPYRMAANIGISVDIYDGKLLIESINRTALPAARFPFQVGDEVVSVDGKGMEEWITYFSQFRQWGSPFTTRRYATDGITYRSSSLYPRTLELGDSAEVVIKRADGATENYTIPWNKTGFTGRNIGPVPTPRARVSKTAEAVAEPVPEYMALLNQMRNWRLPDSDPILQGETADEVTGETLPRR